MCRAMMEHEPQPKGPPKTTIPGQGPFGLMLVEPSPARESASASRLVSPTYITDSIPHLIMEETNLPKDHFLELQSFRHDILCSTFKQTLSLLSYEQEPLNQDQDLFETKHL